MRSANYFLVGAVVFAIVQSSSFVHAQIVNEVTNSREKGEIKVAWTKKLASPSFGSAAVADIDDDGRLEVAFGTYFGDDSVRVLNGEDGSEYWRFDIVNACVDASLRFADLDRDGALELVVPISNQGWVLAFDAKTGDEKWRYATQPIECTDTPPAIVDYDDDGELEVIYGTFAGKLHAISADGQRERVFHPTRHFVQSGPIAHDLDADGTKDLVCATFKGDNTVYAVDGKSGKELWKFKVPGEHVGMYHGPSIGDLDSDGKTELVIGAYDGKVYCLNATDGRKRWEYDTKDSFIMSPTVIADLDQDGKSEVVIASQQMTVLDHQGRLVWTKPCAAGGYDAATRGASVADLNGDGKLDVASLSGSGLLWVWDGITGKLQYKFDAAKICDKPVVSSSHGLTIADLSGDGNLDVFFVVGGTSPVKHGLAVCLTGFAGSGRGWYMLRHDPANTGNVETKLDSGLLRHIENLNPASKAVARPARSPKFGATAAVAQQAFSQSLKKLDRDSVDQLADERGIDRAIVDAAWNHESDFEKHGADGFRAVCLLIETGNHGGTRCHTLLQSTWSPGLETELMKLSERDNLPNFGLWSALRGLGYADTPEVRAYLLRRLQTEQDAGLFMSIAGALGELGEGEGVDDVGEQILRFESNWSGVEPHLLIALQQMDEDSAQVWFERYVLHDDASRFAWPLKQIAKNAPAKARELAASVLEKRDNLTPSQRATLEKFRRQ